MDALQQSTTVRAKERRILLHVVDMDGRPLYRGAAEMGLAQPDPPFAQRFHPLCAPERSKGSPSIEWMLPIRASSFAHAPVCAGMGKARTAAKPWQSDRDLCRRSRDPVQTRQG